MGARRKPGIAPAARRLAICAAAAAWCGAKAQAAIIGTCTIAVLSTGGMTNNAAIDRLGSKEAGGQPAQVRVTANSLVCTVLGLLDCYRISAPAPASFLMSPAGGDTGVTYTTSYRIGAGADIAGNVQTEVLNGNHTVSVDLAAQRASGVFPSGTYQAQVTVRCE
jgi:hypothetical protein